MARSSPTNRGQAPIFRSHRAANRGESFYSDAGNGFGSELRVTSKRGSGLRDGRSPTDLMSLQVATVANWPGGPARDKERSRARGIFPASWPLASVILPHD